MHPYLEPRVIARLQALALDAPPPPAVPTARLLPAGLHLPLAALAGVLLDRLLGEPRRWHPLVGFGRLAGWLEQGLNNPLDRRGIGPGTLAWLLAVLPLVALTMLCHPLYNHLSHGQLNALLALLVLSFGLRRRLGLYGHLIGIPTRPGESCTATTGVPTNSITGFAKGALFINFLGTVGSLLYVNTGSSTSTTWTNIV